MCLFISEIIRKSLVYFVQPIIIIIIITIKKLKIVDLEKWLYLKLHTFIIIFHNLVTKCSYFFQGELLMLRQLEHPNIIKPETSWTEGSQLAIVLPLMPFRSCADVAGKLFPTGISEYSMGQILTHILPAVEYLHDKKIIHR